MACSNCYNGCVETTSDKCVKYTGIDVPVLGIKNGDSLSYIEQALIQFLTSTLDGSGIVLEIAEEDICALVSGHLPDCGNLTLIDLATALTKSACSLQTQVTALAASIQVGEDPYDVDCLAGVSGGEGAHAILQATIDLLCSVNADLTALTLDIETNYVAIADVDTYIGDYLSTVGASTLIANKMVPNTVVEYYGTTTGRFDASGAGIGDWAKIYLCNGLNGTPDKRGRVGVGVTDGTMGNATYDAFVNPAIAGNPVYTLGSKFGTNLVTLNATQIPSHTHTGSITSAGAHTHTLLFAEYPTGISANPGYDGGSNNYDQNVNKTTSSAGDHTHAFSLDSVGGGLAHANNQPALACLYIIYIP